MNTDEKRWRDIGGKCERVRNDYGASVLENEENAAYSLGEMS